MMAGGVELRTLQVFVTLAEELHFARTAERVGLTPSRVSQVVRKLERHIGGPLFVRTSRRVALTPLGTELRDQLGPALTGVDDALAAARGRAHGPGGVLRVGSYHVVIYGETFFTAVKALRRTHPMITVTTVDLGLSQNPLDALRRGEVDALAMRLPLDEPDIVVGPTLSREPRVLLVGRDHPLAHEDALVWEDLADYTVSDSTALPRATMDAFIPPRTPSGRRLRRTTSDSFNEMIAGVLAGDLVHPTVPSMVNYVGHPGVLTVPITDLPTTETALVWLVDNHGHPAVHALATQIAGSTVP